MWKRISLCQCCTVRLFTLMSVWVKKGKKKPFIHSRSPLDAGWRTHLLFGESLRPLKFVACTRPSLFLSIAWWSTSMWDPKLLFCAPTHPRSTWPATEHEPFICLSFTGRLFLACECVTLITCHFNVLPHNCYTSCRAFRNFSPLIVNSSICCSINYTPEPVSIVRKILLLPANPTGL